MILHYLKIAVRQLLKYKFHSIVSALCMALGLTLYGYIGLLLYSSIGPQNEVIISALATGNQADLIQTADLKQFIDKNIEGLKGIKTLTWHNEEADVYVEGDMETPYRAQLKGATPLYFRPVEGEKPRIMRPELCGGALLDLGVYALNFVRMFFPTDIVSMEGQCVKSATGMDLTNAVSLVLADGAAAAGAVRGLRHLPPGGAAGDAAHLHPGESGLGTLFHPP